MDCTVCHVAINSSEEKILCCSMNECSNALHYLCFTGGRPMQINNNDTWVCTECQSKLEKGTCNNPKTLTVCNDNAISSHPSHPNVTYRKKVIGSSDTIDTNDLSLDIRLLHSEMHALKNQLNLAMSTIVTYQEKMEQYSGKIVALDTKLKMYETNKVNNIQGCHNCVMKSKPAISNSLVAELREVSMKPAQKQTTLNPVTPNPVTPNPVTPNPVTQPLHINISNKEPNIIKQDLTVSNKHTNNPPLADVTKPNEQWILVEKKKKWQPPTLRGTACTSTTTLKAVEPRKFLHLWNMASNIDDVRSYLQQLCPTGNITIEELTPKGEYKSYKIGVAENCYETCYCVDAWPINARIKPWIQFRKPRIQINSPKEKLPFRHAAEHK